MTRPISSSQQHKRLGRINTRRKAERNEGRSSEEPGQPGRRGSEQRRTGFGDTTQLVGSETGRAHLLRSQRTSRPEGVAMDTCRKENLLANTASTIFLAAGVWFSKQPSTSSFCREKSEVNLFISLKCDVNSPTRWN